MKPIFNIIMKKDVHADNYQNVFLNKSIYLSGECI